MNIKVADMVAEAGVQLWLDECGFRALIMQGL